MAKNFENAKTAARKFGAEKAVSSLEELVDLGLDCAFVLTPKAAHMEQIKFLIEHCVHTFSEKPMATTMKDCASIVGFQRRPTRKS